ncbi:hypothetical protein U1Q18_042114 [Sarracenia purpurea var. burkii]
MVGAHNPFPGDAIPPPFHSFHLFTSSLGLFIKNCSQNRRHGDCDGGGVERQRRSKEDAGLGLQLAKEFGRHGGGGGGVERRRGGEATMSKEATARERERQG